MNDLAKEIDDLFGDIDLGKDPEEPLDPPEPPEPSDPPEPPEPPESPEPPEPEEPPEPPEPAEPPEPPEPEEPTEKEKALEEQNRTLMEKLENLTSMVQNSLKKEEPKEEELPEEFKGFLGDLDIDDVVSDKQKFEQVLSHVVDHTRRVTMEQMMNSVPGLVVTQIRQQRALKESVDDFYKENSDLLPVRKTVGAIANEIASENPNIPMNELFEKAAVKTREILGLTKKTSARANAPATTRRKPGLATPTRANRPSSPQLSPTEKDIVDTLL